MYRFARIILRFFGFFAFRIKVEGKQNIIYDRGTIMAANHKSNWDPVVIAMTCPRKLTFMAKYELFKFKPFGAFLKSMGAFPVHRGKGDLGAIKAALSILKDEKMMLMFPEGKRVKAGEKVLAKPGVAMMATRAKVPVLPVTISGKFRWMSKITITYGEPIEFSEFYGEKLSMEKLQELSEDIMENIRSAENRQVANK